MNLKLCALMLKQRHTSNFLAFEASLMSFPEIKVLEVEFKFDSSCCSLSITTASSPYTTRENAHQCVDKQLRVKKNLIIQFVIYEKSTCPRSDKQKASSSFKSMPSDAIRHSQIFLAFLICKRNINRLSCIEM